jgi:hypothetical protein
MLRLASVFLGAALLTALLSCQQDIIPFETGGTCPANPPVAGEACGHPVECNYAGTECAGLFSCQGGTWVQQSHCPPPPPPGSCPSSLPGPGTPCSTPAQSCTFDVPGDCPGVFLATCTASGWSVADQSPPCMPSTCPSTEPTAGTPCSSPASCTYTVLPDGCPPHTENATCAGGVWTIDVPAPCGP